MALLKKMPSQYLIRNLRGVLDFYEYKGKPCVRKWPKKPQLTPKMKATHKNLKDALDLWNKMPQIDRQAFTFAVSGSEYINRDMFCANVMLMGTPRTVIHVVEMKVNPATIKVTVVLIQGHHPKVKYLFNEYAGISSCLTWRLKYEKMSGVRKGAKLYPVFKPGKYVSIVWTPKKGFFHIPNQHKNLFFWFEDPFNVTKFCTGVYYADCT